MIHWSFTLQHSISEVPAGSLKQLLRSAKTAFQFATVQDSLHRCSQNPCWDCSRKVPAPIVAAVCVQLSHTTNPAAGWETLVAGTFGSFAFSVLCHQAIFCYTFWNLQLATENLQTAYGSSSFLKYIESYWRSSNHTYSSEEAWARGLSTEVSAWI